MDDNIIVSKVVSNEILHKEIDLLQSCIERMAKNSFACKGWNLTLIAGMCALMPEKINKFYIFVTIFGVNLCFWWLDTYFLEQERKYRDKYNWVISNRINGNRKYLYDLNNNNPETMISNKSNSHIKAAFSKTLVPMYGGIFILTILFILINTYGG